MVVIIHKIVDIEGKKREIESFLPSESLLTKDVIEAAKKSNDAIKNFCDVVNSKYEFLPKEKQKNALMKWRWLGEQLDIFFNNEQLIQKSDINRNVIWPAIGQYLRNELSSGINTKRSGTSKDHYRKCYMLAKCSGTNWFNSWLAWDAFIDRADQLVENDFLLPALEEVFLGLNLNVKDFQFIAKLTAELLPSTTANPAVIVAMKQPEIKEIAYAVKKRFKSKV